VVLRVDAFPQVRSLEVVLVDVVPLVKVAVEAVVEAVVAFSVFVVLSYIFTFGRWKIY
jgi:hypothetical protein